MIQLAQSYKQVNAAFGQFAMNMLAASTNALKSGSASDDSSYLAIQSGIASLTAERDALASRMRSVLAGATFGNSPASPVEIHSLIRRGQRLLDDAGRLAGG